MIKVESEWWVYLIFAHRSDSNNHRIQVFDVNGKVIATFGVEGADEGQFKFPR